MQFNSHTRLPYVHYMYSKQIFSTYSTQSSHSEPKKTATINSHSSYCEYNSHFCFVEISKRKLTYCMCQKSFFLNKYLVNIQYHDPLTSKTWEINIWDLLKIYQWCKCTSRHYATHTCAWYFKNLIEKNSFIHAFACLMFSYWLHFRSTPPLLIDRN